MTAEPEAMSHNDAAAAWCLRLAEGPLNASEREAFQAWLDADAGNQARFDTVAAFWCATEEQSEQPEMIRLRETTLATYRRVQTRRWGGDGISRRAWLAMAASLVLGVGAVGWWAMAEERYETRVGERRAVTLADGSKLSLDADTLVRVRYSSGRRRLVLERGRASFDVAKDAARPFSVRAGARTVIATGTAFSVEKLTDQVQVVLFEGHVRVVDTSGAQVTATTAGHETGPADAGLVPGKRLVLKTGETVARLDTAPEATPRAWEAGQLEFDDEPLSIAAERMNRYATKARLDVSPDAADIRVSGVFNAGDTDIFASEVAATFGVKLSQDDRTITLSRR